MSHPNARLTLIARREMVQMVLAGWPQAEVARLFRVSRVTVGKWVRRFAAEGQAGLRDRSSRPRRHPHQVSPEREVAIVTLRQERAWGPHRIAWALGIARSTVYQVLRRAGLHRLAWLHRTTRQVVRYEHPHPGDLLHLDVKRLGRIPEGGGKRVAPGFPLTRSGPNSRRRQGWEYLHVAIDDHPRYAYVEALPDERAGATAGFLERTLDHFAQRGVRVQRVLTDNGGNYRSHLFLLAAQAQAVRLKRTRPFRPQTNGKAEAFNKIIQAEWAYLRPYQSNAERLTTLPHFLLYYNHERSHGGIGGATPSSRL